MSKEKVFIVLNHKHSLKKNVRGFVTNEWEVTETVEFVNQLRNKHITMSSASADYLNRKILSGSRFGFTDYEKFDTYVREKYPKQMAELDLVYKDQQIKEDNTTKLMKDQFGNTRQKTIFDQL